MTKLGDVKWDKQESTKKPLGDGDKQTMVEYYEAGLKTGKRSEDLLTELEKLYGRSSRQILRYVSKARESGKPYQETPHKQEESLIVHGLSPGATDVEFLVTNMSNNLLVVDRICVEIMHWEQYDARLITGARIKDFKYKVKINPNFIGEILVRTPKFKYAKGDVDSFSISFISPPGNKYITRINFYCSDPETGKRFAVSTDKFEIRFHKHRIVSGEGTSSIHGAIAQAQKLLDEAKRKK